MELKIICQCGQKYKFDVEPVNGRMPFTVKCPICGLDGTGTANTMLAARTAAPPTARMATPPVAAQVGAVAPPPAMASAPAPVSVSPPPPPVGLRTNPVAPATVAAAAPPPPPIAPQVAGLRINHAAPASAGPPVATVGGDNNAPPALGANRPFAVSAAANPPKKTSFGKGILGAAIGALAGSLVYYLVMHFSGIYGFFGLRFLAIGVGALAGWLADLMGKGEGSKELGGIAAVLVIAGVLGAQYFVALGWWHTIRDEALKSVQSVYADAVVEAKKVVDAVPTGSDAEIRSYLAKSESEDGDTKVMPASISDDDVKDFRDNQLPEYQNLASGKLTKQEYEDKHRIKTSESKDDGDSDDSSTVKLVFMAIVFSRSNIFGMIAAAALAFKLSVNN